MDINQLKFWLKAILRNPSLGKWYFHWVASQNGRRTPLSDGLPWMTYEAIDWLTKRLTKKMVLFEWGSGGSTVFFSKFLKQVIAVEHDPLWYRQVIDEQRENRITNVYLRLEEPMPSDTMDPWYASTGAEFDGFSFERYIRVIDEYPDSFFDVVVVDGRARLGCMKHAVAKIKPGGYMILDNSERAAYEAAFPLLSGWDSVILFGPGPYNPTPWETRIWQKRSSEFL